MRTAMIEFKGTLTVYQDDDEWEGDDLTTYEASGWVEHAMSRGDKHAGGYLFGGALITGVTYGEEEDDE